MTLARSFKVAALAGAITVSAFAASTTRQTIAAAIVEQDDEKKLALISSLAGGASPDIARLLALWKEDAIYLYKTTDDKVIPVQLGEDKDADGKQPATKIEDDAPLLDAEGKPIRLLASDLDAAAHDSNLRGVMKGVLDLQALADPDPAKRILAIGTLGMARTPKSCLLCWRVNLPKPIPPPSAPSAKPSP